MKFASDSLPRFLNPGESFIFDLPVGLDAVVNDVDCRVSIDQAVAWNMQIEVISPEGTSALIWDALGGCGLNTPLFARFDDEGIESNQCVDLNADLNLDVMSVSGFDSLGVFDGENTEGTWQVRISNPDLQGFGYVALVDIVELYINMTGQFSAGFPNGLSGNCVQPLGNQQYLVPAGCGNPLLDNCSAVTLSYVDAIVQEDCFTAYIDRTWTAQDLYNNITTCIQRINQIRPSLTDVVLPPDYDGISAPALDCTGGSFASPDWISGQGLQGEPLVFGLPAGCTINWGYTDNVITVCDGAYKILREWLVIDWCTGESITHNQIIKVSDGQGPGLACPQNLSVSTDAFTCCATVDLPDMIVTDGCSRIHTTHAIITLFDPITGLQTGIQTIDGSLTNFVGNNLSDPDTMAVFGFPNCLPKGAHTVDYYVEDDCGNTASCSFQLTVNDYTPPIAVCDEMTVVAIGLDDPADCYGPAGPDNFPPALDDCQFAGVTWVKASAFDNGSYDGCDSVKLTIRRTPPFSACTNGLNPYNGEAPCDDFFPDFPSEFERAISESDSIKFYSCEVGTIQTVKLRVYQLDANGNLAQNPNGAPIFSDCNIQVEVADKIKPVCIPPANVSVTCEQFDPSLSTYGIASITDNCCLDTVYQYLGQCGLNQQVNYSNFDTLCNKGTILRRFEAFDCHGNSSFCTQQVVVNFEQDYYVHFPNDVVVTNCNGTGIYGEPTFFGEDCELLATSYEDEVFPITPDACYKIERNWTVINWCTYNPIDPLTVIPNPNPNPVTNHPANLPGPIVSACGTQPPWSATIVKINPTDPAPTDYCVFWDANANGYRYKQIIKIIDMQGPAIEDCPAGSVTMIDSTQNNPELWHNVFDPNLPAQDLKEGRTDLTITSSDDCSATNLSGGFLLFLDLDNDGQQESVVNSVNLQGADTIRYNNLNTPGYLGGIPVTFDSRPVPTNQKWHFTLYRNSTPTHVTTSVRWNTAQSPNTYVTPELPQGTHKIRWATSDQCGNQNVCEHTFTIEQGPTSGIDILEKDGFALFQNEPNPFSQSTRIAFRLPSASEAKLSVFDAEGRLVFEKTDQFREGLNTVQLEGNQLGVSSILYYKLESGAHIAWRKMVFIR